MGAQPETDGSAGFPPFPIRPATTANGSSGGGADDGPMESSGGLALSIIIVIGICFLVLNVCACAGVFYQRDRVRFKEMLLQRQYKLHPAGSGRPPTANAAEESEPDRERQLCSKAEEEDSADDMLRGVGLLPHQASTSTMDPHTKVSQWMVAQQQEVVIEPCPLPGNHHKKSGGSGSNNHTKSGRTGLLSGKLGGSDRYDPRGLDDDPCSMFPQLAKSNKATDIYGLMVIPSKEESSQQQQEVVVIEQVPRSDSAAGSVSTAGTLGRRRKARSRSITKRDVAVGDDDEGNRDSWAAPASLAENVSPGPNAETIRRLNLPKVLPDFPPPPADEMSGTLSRSSRGSILKTNLPQTLVVAPHPRLTSSSSSSQPSPSPTTSVSVPEPSLVVRPGVARSSDQPDVVLRRPVSGRPASINGSNRNSRSWYPQYSQSLMSQSIDLEPSAVAESDLRET